MATYEDIVKANESIRTTDIKGKDYAEVNQRIKAFRMVHPDGYIETEMVSNEGGICIFRATVGDQDHILGTGTAYEKENSSFINKTSYIENCETSAVGRALGMAGFGIDTSVASYEEVANAIENQNKTVEDNRDKTVEMINEAQMAVIRKKYPTQETMASLLAYLRVKKLEDVTAEVAAKVIIQINEKEKAKK